MTPLLPAGENLKMAFTLMQWDAVSKAFTVRSTGVTPSTSNTTQQPTTTTTTTTTRSTTDGSIFGTGTTVSAGSVYLYLLSIIYAVVCCAGGTPVC